MKWNSYYVIAAALVALSACGRSDEGQTNNAAADMAMNDMGMEGSMMADPSNPFAPVEMNMNRAMMGAAGVNAADSWVRLMIAHHQGAVDMARIALQQDVPADVKKMAKETVDKQTKEIADLQKLVQKGQPNASSLDVYRPAMMQMHQAMMNAKGASVAETFMRKMLEHHKGGVTLSDVALDNHVSGPVRAQVQKTRAGQQKDAEMTEAMLRGVPSGEAKEKASASSVAPGGNKAASRKAMPVPGTRTPEHEAHDMDNMSHDMNNM